MPEDGIASRSSMGLSSGLSSALPSFATGSRRFSAGSARLSNASSSHAAREEPLLENSEDVEAGHLELPPWRPEDHKGNEANKTEVDVYVEEKEWGAGMGLDSSDSDFDPRERRKPVRRSSASSSGAKPGSTSEKGVIEVSEEWAGGIGLSSSDSDSNEDARQKEREARRNRQADNKVEFAEGGSSSSGPEIGHGGRRQRRSSADQKDRRSAPPSDPVSFRQSFRFMCVTLLGILDFGLQFWCLFIYLEHKSYTVLWLVPIQVMGILFSSYITFHDTDVLHFLHKGWEPCTRRYLCLMICMLFGCCKGIQVKRAWARQLSAAEILTDMDDNEDSRASTPKTMGAFGGAERAIPVALLTNVPFLLVNTIAFLTAKWVWNSRDQRVLAVASCVSLANVSIGIIEIDLAVSSYVFKRWHLSFNVVGTRAGRFQCLYPVAHVIFRASEVCLRVLFFTATWWILEPFGKEWLVLCFGLDYYLGLFVLKHFSSSEEKFMTHVVMAMLMLVADLTHFVDQPNFTVPAKQISFVLSAWRLLNMCALTGVSWARGTYLLDACGATPTVVPPENCEVVLKRGWIFEMNCVLFSFLTYAFLRFSKPIRSVGDDLHTAAVAGNDQRILKLLQPDKFNQVLDVNAVTKDGTKMTPAMFAAKFGHQQVLIYLDQAGANLDAQNREGNTCLHLAAQSDSLNHVETVKWLLGRGARHDIRNHQGRIPEALALPGGLALEAFEQFHSSSSPRRRNRTSLMSTSATNHCDAVPLIACGSVQLQGLFPDADDQDSTSPRALLSVSGLVFSRAAGLLARRVLARTDDSGGGGAVPLGALRRVGELGRGGFGHVIEVELPNQRIGGFFGERKARRFALKLQLKQGSQRSAFSEVLALRTVHHRFIVRLERAFQTPKFYALLLELCPNDLNRMLCDDSIGQRCAGLSVQRTAKYLGQTLLALKHLHEMEGGGIVYRDVKPENILISVEDDAKLTDFGLAKVVTKEERMTMCGTMGFFPPELLNCDLIEELDGSFHSSMGSTERTEGGMDSLAARSRSSFVNGGFDPFKLDSYAFGVTLQVTLLGEDGAQRKEIRKKGFMMLPMHLSEEENIELLKTLRGNGRLSEEAYDLLVEKLQPFHPKQRYRLANNEVVNHPFFLKALECQDLKNFLMNGIK